MDSGRLVRFGRHQVHRGQELARTVKRPGRVDPADPAGRVVQAGHAAQADPAQRYQARRRPVFAAEA